MNVLGLVKNPLSVIAIFASSAEISGAAVLPFITPENQSLYIWFLMFFPLTLVLVFFATLNWNHKALYAPSDYSSDASFLELSRSSHLPRPEVSGLKDSIDQNIDTAVGSALKGSKGDPSEGERIADEIKKLIKKSSFIKVDASQLTGNENSIYELPFVAFPTLNNLTDEIYFLIKNHVNPFEYGHSWILRFADGNQVIKNSRMITGTKKGTPCPDMRSLEEMGIKPGITLLVTRP